MPLPKFIIERPPLTPLPYGILSAAVVRDETDPHTAAGVTWEPDYCGPTRTTLAACLTSESTSTVSVDDTGEATFDITVPGVGDGAIDWGDGTALDTSGNWTHTYADPGDYNVTFDGGNQSHTVVPITVVDGVASGPFEAAASFITDKDGYERAGWVETHPFTVYHISTCRLPGVKEREAYATRALQLGEGRGIEYGLAEVFSTPGVDITILDSGAAAAPLVALARLERKAGQVYGGVATLHMDRAVASFLLALYALETRSGKLYTKLGNLVVAGASGYEYPGYPDSAPTPGAGESWMIATGTVVVTRNPIKTTPAVISTGGLIDNEYSVLAERSVSVGWECFAAAHMVAALDAP